MSVISPYLINSDNPSKDQIKKCNVSELQAFLAGMGLTTTGKKSELVDRVFDFFQNLQNPTRASTVSPTCSVSFQTREVMSVSALRQLLENYGPLSYMAYNPSDQRCYACFLDVRSSSSLVEDSVNESFLEAKYVLESEIENAVCDLHLIKKGVHIRECPHSIFHRTVCEPRLFWKSRTDD